jgi:hypothetical protein
MCPYIGVESGTHDVPELSRLMGSAMLTVDCICISWDECDEWDLPSGLFEVRCSLRAVLAVAVATEGGLDAERFFSSLGTSFIPHFGQLPG